MFPLFRKTPPPVLSTAEIVEFRTLCEEVSDLWRQRGRERRAVNADFPARLLSRPQPRRSLEMLRVYRELLATEKIEDKAPLSDKKLLWKMLSRLELRPCSDLLDSIDDGDIVEVYTTENWQIFRNDRCLELVDMTVEEFCTFYWDRDVKRSFTITKEGLSLVFLMITGLMRRTFHIHTMPRHPVRVFGNGRWQDLEMAMKLASPLFRQGKLEGYVVTSRSSIFV